MNRGGNTSPASGFTIVETLIVLAVTSALLVSAMITMSGRQAKTDFQVGREAVVRQLQSLVSQIESGRYKTTNNFTCSTTNFYYGPYVQFTDPATGEQGANGACVYVGLALVFGDGSNDKYDTYVMAGGRIHYGAEMKTIAEMKPKTTAGSKQTEKLPNGLTYVSSKFIANDGTVYTTPAGQPFVARLMIDANDADLAKGTLAGSQKVVVNRTEPWNTNVITTINFPNADGDAVLFSQPMKGMQVCFASGGTNQSVLVSFGTAWGNKISSEVKAGRTC